MEKGSVCATSEPIHQAWAADREASCPSHVEIATVAAVERVGAEVLDGEIDATTLPYGHSNIDSAVETHCELKVLFHGLMVTKAVKLVCI